MNQTLTQIQEEFDEKFSHTDECLTFRFEDFEDGRVENCYCQIKDIKSFLTQSNLRVLEKMKHGVEEEISELETWAKVSKNEQDVKEYKFAVFVLKKVLSTLIKQK